MKTSEQQPQPVYCIWYYGTGKKNARLLILCLVWFRLLSPCYCQKIIRFWHIIHHLGMARINCTICMFVIFVYFVYTSAYDANCDWR